EYVGAVKSFADPGMMPASNGGCDEKFIPFYNLQLLAGRNFSPGDSSNIHSIILSKAGTQRLGFARPQDAIGQIVYVSGENKANVIGVINDYKLQPFLTQGVDLSYQGNAGIILTYGDRIATQNKLRKVAIKVDHANLEATIARIETIFTTAFSDDLFNWYFLDQLIDSRYAIYETSLNQITFYAIIATFIACLGLLGMVTNKAIEKTREIGIRKVLGAGYLEIASVLLNTTLRQIIIATVISIPLAWFLTKSYLNNFSERVQQEWWFYALPILGLITIFMVTIGFRLTKILKSRAVESLKHE
ncbi:MAG TPA: FtsX-like permease family protein, partial [Puia sp.]|nr:FtsX-like permease family protein [Puia sp.]